MTLKIFFLFFLLFSNAVLYAADKAIVCAKYEVRFGWSKSYKVEATLTDGNELNYATGSMNYNVISKYIVIFWDRDQASVIELDMPFIMPGVLGNQGKDQRGRKWEISFPLGYLCM